jgi:hypothetical protein
VGPSDADVVDVVDVVDMVDVLDGFDGANVVAGDVGFAAADTPGAGGTTTVVATAAVPVAVETGTSNGDVRVVDGVCGPGSSVGPKPPGGALGATRDSGPNGDDWPIGAEGVTPSEPIRLA